MVFRKVLALRGPNVWAHFPVLEAWVDLGLLKDTSSDEMPGFNDRLKGWLPGMIEHRCSVGERGGFFERLRRGTYLAHILEHVTLELQSLAGSMVGFGRARETSEAGVYKVAIEYEEETLARACLDEGLQLCLAAVEGTDYAVEEQVARLRARGEEVRLGPSTAAIVAAAKARGIPARRLNSGSLVMLGQGAHQRRIVAAETDRCGAIAEAIAQDKDLTRTLLRAVGVPVPEGRPVVDAADARLAAAEIDGPVVVKPRYGNHGRGVATNLATPEQVEAAYILALEESAEIVVERHALGADFRLLVVDGRVVAAARRDPAQVLGDGEATVAELVRRVNLDPRRGQGHAQTLTRIELDANALTVLGEQGYATDTVPSFGVVVLIRRNANLSTGGTATDVTDEVHPEVAARAVDAARVIGLDVAGVDLIVGRIDRPMEEQGGVVVEVNAGPGLRMHLQPSSGRPRPVGEAIVESLFPGGGNGRVPIIAVTGVNGKTTTARLTAHILGRTGRTVGLTCTDGIVVAGRTIEDGDCSGPGSARSVLINPLVEAAVLETARGGLLREGLGFDRCDVAIVTNIGEGDHLGLADIDDVERLAEVKRTVVEAVARDGTAVLNAHEPLVAAMAEYCSGSVIFFARDPDLPALKAHREAGGRTAFVRDGSIVLAAAQGETLLTTLGRVPLTHDGRAGFQVENALAAAAATWAIGVPLAAIREGLATFRNDDRHTPGRFNILRAGGATVILDYGHNASALLALVEAFERLPHERRSVVYTAVGDRRDADIVRLGEVIGQSFDSAYLFEDQYVRGRPAGEITGLLRLGIGGEGRCRRVLEYRNEFPAIDAALAALRAGDLLLIQPDSVDAAFRHVRDRLDADPPREAETTLAACSIRSAEGVGVPFSD